MYQDVVCTFMTENTFVNKNRAVFKSTYLSLNVNAV